MKKIISLIITALMLTVFSVSAFAYDDYYYRHHRRHHRRHVSTVRVVVPVPIINITTGRGHDGRGEYRR